MSNAVQTAQLDGPIDLFEPLSAKCRVFGFDHLGEIDKALDVSFHSPDGIELPIERVIDWPKLF